MRRCGLVYCRRGIWSVSSAASLCSTPRDMAHWVAALLHSASHSTDNCKHLLCRVLPPSVIRETFRPQIIASHMMPSQIRRPHTDVPFHVDGYGLGWFTGYYRGTSHEIRTISNSIYITAPTFMAACLPIHGVFVMLYNVTNVYSSICYSSISNKLGYSVYFYSSSSSSSCESANFNRLKTPALGCVCMVSCVLGFANINNSSCRL